MKKKNNKRGRIFYRTIKEKKKAKGKNKLFLKNGERKKQE